MLISKERSIAVHFWVALKTPAFTKCILRMTRI
jgi:hypothetical protein